MKIHPKVAGWTLVNHPMYVMQGGDRIVCEGYNFKNPHTVVNNPGYHGQTLEQSFPQKYYKNYWFAIYTKTKVPLGMEYGGQSLARRLPLNPIFSKTLKIP